MDVFETNTHPFIVKVWLEETTEQAGRATWRGHITHVPSGQGCYVQDLSSISSFVALYLAELGVKPSLWTRLSWWLHKPHRLDGPE